ncbi:MAG: hypothetical protein JRI23_06680 [Deltaproteobacteria bacterium]|nr:hypothetical protein [Deltaproteobacteria bacterium]MBW2531272.1 hypothetical protein [Deltaproteobacteria bacterium]
MNAAGAGSHHVGVDENGLGPRLGPLVVTAAMARMDQGGREAMNRLRQGDVTRRLGDSKGLVSHKNVALGEAWARAVTARGAGRGALAARGPGDGRPSSDELLHDLALDDRDALRAPCPAHVASQCWSPEHDPRGDDERIERLTREVSADLDALAREGMELVAVRSVILCTHRLNLALREGRSRLVEDLHAMERLVLEMRAIAGCDVEAVCGKVGGYKDYRKVFGPFGDRLHTVVEEGPARSAYRIAGVGEVAFSRDADEDDLLVGLASLIGKYVRELAMGRIVAHYRKQLPELPDASGYNDPVTARFVAATAEERRRAKVPDSCFERLKAADLKRR